MQSILVDQLKVTRALALKITADMSTDDLLKIPEGYNNNLAWNLGHLVVTQQLLHYKLSGLPMHVSDEMVTAFAKGSGPKDWTSSPDMEEIRTLLVELPDRLAEDLAADRFDSFGRYETSAGVVLETFDHALAFNHYHEGIHLGYMLALKRAL